MSASSGLADFAARGARLHLVGIGGAGMAGLALLLQARGAQVSGCDREASETTEDLERRGIAVRRGHDSEHMGGIDAVVHTAAVPLDHPELAAAQMRGLPVLKRSDALAELVNAGSLVAVAGTHGKTTTTALTATALEGAGFDPTALVGGRVPGWKGNARIGASDLYVVEADEYDRAFLSLRPRVAVVTSVEAEHLDTYRSVEDLEAAFDEFLGRMPGGGQVIACYDEPGARRRLDRVGARGSSYGLKPGAELQASAVIQDPDRTRFSVGWRGNELGEFELALRGRHNVLNALAALGVTLALGREPRSVAAALAKFTGVERRFQTLGTARGITVVDDYAHHPTEVRATLATAVQAFPGRRLVAAFQPHLYSRTAALAGDFGRALAAADLAFVTEIYAAREDPIAGVSAALVVEAAGAAMGADRVRFATRLPELREALVAELEEGDVLVTLGAGDIGSVAHAVWDDLWRSHVDA